MDELGLVTHVENEDIYISVRRHSACGTDCSTCSAKCAESKLEILKFKNTIDAKRGDLVKLKTDQRSVFSYIFLVYGLPLIMFMIGTCISYMLLKNNQKEFISFLVGTFCMILAYFIIKRIDKKIHTETLIHIEKFKDYE